MASWKTWVDKWKKCIQCKQLTRNTWGGLCARCQQAKRLETKDNDRN